MKFKYNEGFAASSVFGHTGPVGAVTFAVALPDSATLACPWFTSMVAVNVPAAWGANDVEMVHDAFASIIVEQLFVSRKELESTPEIAMPEIETAVAPLFVSTTLCGGTGVPTAVDGKLMVAGANSKKVIGVVGAAGAVGVMPIEKFGGS